MHDHSKATRYFALVIMLTTVFLFGCDTAIEVTKPPNNEASESTGESDESISKAEFDRTVAEFELYESKHGHSFDAPNTKIHYLRWGNEGTPFVWLHGTYSSAYEFAPFAESLAEQGYQVISVDWYGHGSTSIPHDEVTTLDWANDLEALTNHLGFETFILGGWSRGGMLAAVYRNAFPQKTKALILADGGSWNLKEVFDAMSDQELQDLGKGWADKNGRVPALTFDSQFDLFRRFVQPETPQFSKFALLAKATRNEDQRWALFSMKTIRWLRQQTTDDAFKGMRDPSSSSKFFEECANLKPEILFANLDVPVLVIDPTLDSMDASEQNKRLKDQHPNLIEYVIYDDSGHSVMMSNPDRFRDDISSFLEHVRTAVNQ